MPSTYEASPRPHLLHRGEKERVSRVPLRGIPTITSSLLLFWQQHGFDVEPPAELLAINEQRIAAAMAEHKLRREALLQGVELPAGDRA